MRFALRRRTAVPQIVERLCGHEDCPGMLVATGQQAPHEEKSGEHVLLIHHVCTICRQTYILKNESYPRIDWLPGDVIPELLTPSGSPVPPSTSGLIQ
jgi:hypothetical protein